MQWVGLGGVLGMLALAGCSPAVPDSAAGVGFDNYSEYQRKQATREAELRGTTALPAAQAVSAETLPASGATQVTAAASVPASTAPESEAERLAAETAAALNSGQAPLQASPGNPAPQVALAPSGISEENDFENVASLRSIDADKAHIAQNRAQYEVVEPTELPTRTGREGPNIVAFALDTSHPLGQQMYKRFAASETRAARNCAKYASSDQAQADFLAKGGPDKDRLGIDPDGDGYACRWDPSPYRNVTGG